MYLKDEIEVGYTFPSIKFIQTLLTRNLLRETRSFPVKNNLGLFTLTLDEKL